MITIKNLYLYRGTECLLEDASVTLFGGQKVGLTGANGTGKSSFFALLQKEIQADKGTVEIQPNWVFAHVEQEMPATEETALSYVLQGDKELQQIEESILEAEQKQDYEKLAELHGKLGDIDGYTAHARAGKLLHGLGFSSEELQKPVNAFSGGWRMRLNLAKALMCRSDVLLLDEPTNHLDLDAVLWLEGFLQNYPGLLLLISHDREFLDAVANNMVIIKNKTLSLYSGNYSAFERKHAEDLSRQQQLYVRQQEVIEHHKAFIARFKAKASKAKQAQSRMKALERMEIISEAHKDSPFYFSFPPIEPCGSPLLSLENIQVSYGDKCILDNLSLSVMAGERIGLLGPNGAGKSSFIKILSKTNAPSKGFITEARGLKIGYYAQHQLEQLYLDETPLQHMKAIDKRSSDQVLRNFLGGFDFQGDMALSPITHFSGGEKARLALALIVWSKPHILLLDEPTNHLDLEMRFALAQALQHYEGALVIVSHDRYLLSSTVDKYWLVANKTVQPFDGNLDDYRQWLAKEHIPGGQVSENEKKSPQNNARRKELQSSLKSQESQLEKVIFEMEKLETELAKVSQEGKAEDIQILNKKHKTLQEKREAIEEEWLKVQEELERF